jgi:hypothetical protein
MPDAIALQVAFGCRLSRLLRRALPFLADGIIGSAAIAAAGPDVS